MKAENPVPRRVWLQERDCPTRFEVVDRMPHESAVLDPSASPPLADIVRQYIRQELHSEEPSPRDEALPFFADDDEAPGTVHELLAVEEDVIAEQTAEEFIAGPQEGPGEPEPSSVSAEAAVDLEESTTEGAQYVT